MAQEKGRYYTRSRKVNGKVIREYVGCGKVGELAAQQDAEGRERRERERKAWSVEREQIEAFDETIAMVCQMADLTARAAMVAAGFHRRRGEWRRRRDPNNGSQSS